MERNRTRREQEQINVRARGQKEESKKIQRRCEQSCRKKKARCKQE